MCIRDSLLWGDLFTIPLGGGIGISFMVVLLFTAGIWFTCRDVYKRQSLVNPTTLLSITFTA